MEIPIDYREERILLVDDDKDFRHTLKELLRHIGFNTNPVGDAISALEELKQNKTYTFLITDIVMPEMDGLELTRRVKQNYPDICIIAMTGFSNQYNYIEVINAGATDFINKPFRTDELEAKIRRGIFERNTQRELKRLCITDALTGLYNQRHFFSRLKEEIIRAQRQKQQLAMIFFDLDDFKLYNDKNGHLAGDAVLQKFGEIINSQIRRGVDSGYRYGGDEFAVILTNADSDSCQIIGERIIENFKKECGTCVSMGYAFFSKEMSPESFVEQADRNLYKLKVQKNALNSGKHKPRSNDSFQTKSGYLNPITGLLPRELYPDAFYHNNDRLTQTAEPESSGISKIITPHTLP